MSKEPVHNQIKYSQIKLNFNNFNVTSLTSTTPETGPSTLEPAQPDEPQSSSSATAETVKTAGMVVPKQAGSDCMEVCCRDIEKGKAAQLIVDKKETARSFGQRERYFNAEWYKIREWLILCKTT